MASQLSLAAVTLQQLAAEISPDDAASLASDFLNDLDSMLAGIHLAISKQQADDARRLAHSLKGTASIFGLKSLQAAAEEIESASRNLDLPAAAALIPALSDASTPVRHQIPIVIRIRIRHRKIQTILPLPHITHPIPIKILRRNIQRHPRPRHRLRQQLRIKTRIVAHIQILMQLHR